MSKLEDLQPLAAVRGILPDAVVTVVNVQRSGSEARVMKVVKGGLNGIY